MVRRFINWLNQPVTENVATCIVLTIGAAPLLAICLVLIAM